MIWYSSANRYWCSSALHRCFRVKYSDLAYAEHENTSVPLIQQSANGFTVQGIHVLHLYRNRTWRRSSSHTWLVKHILAKKGWCWRQVETTPRDCGQNPRLFLKEEKGFGKVHKGRVREDNRSLHQVLQASHHGLMELGYPNKGIKVFPGMEVNVAEGGQVLAVGPMEAIAELNHR